MTEGLIAQARAADEEARHHKRLERAHRHKARAARERQAEIERHCARLGITIVYELPTPQSAKDPIHGQNQTHSRPQHAD